MRLLKTIVSIANLFVLIAKYHLTPSSSKHKKLYGDFRKVIMVAKSCLTPEHCEGAWGYLAVYMNHYKITPEKNPMIMKLCSEVLSYLIDTRKHAEQGHHNPEWNQYKTVNTFPDINKYIGKHIDIRV